MALEPGMTFRGKIVSNTVREIGDKVAVQLEVVAPEGEHVRPLIFLTEASANMARAQLRVCGFDFERQKLSELVDDETLLAGREIQIEMEEYNGKLQARIQTSGAPSKARLAKLDAILASAKKPPVWTNKPKPAEPEPSPVDEADIPF